MTTENYGFLCEISPLFRPYVLNIYHDLKLGLCKTKVDLERVGGSANTLENQFRLVLPYCSKKIEMGCNIRSFHPLVCTRF